MAGCKVLKDQALNRTMVLEQKNAGDPGDEERVRPFLRS